MKHFERWMSAVAVCLALSNVAFPQASSSSLRGTVTDPSGRALPGATVVIANPESKITRTATTGGLGDYQFLALPQPAGECF
ncbi:MAG TPA: carboxypeptidase-like regulatory domain-containing protein [Terriglobales bacterium]|nr:carboxypeptidase-like regulatory domain-containing protein [Terriglobales bacterium]